MTREKDDIPVVKGYVDAEGRHRIEAPPDLRGYPVRFVIEDADGRITMDEVHHGPPESSRSSQSDEDLLAEMREELLELRRMDPERYKEVVAKLRQVGMAPEGLLPEDPK